MGNKTCTIPYSLVSLSSTRYLLLLAFQISHGSVFCILSRIISYNQKDMGSHELTPWQPEPETPHWIFKIVLLFRAVLSSQKN